MEFAGDASRCLDANSEQVAAEPGASEIAVVLHEIDEPQGMRDPRRSWTLSLARFEVQGMVIEAFDYVDCLSLIPGEAVLVRTFLGPAAAFEANVDRLDVLNAALPRCVDQPDESNWGASGGSPLLANPAWSFKGLVGGTPRPLFGVDGRERLAIHLVDFEGATRV